VSSQCEITWRVIDERSVTDRAPAPEAGSVHNISCGGLCFASSEAPPVGGMLAIKMRLPEVPMPVIALGRAMWVEDGAAGYEVGIEFWWVGWQDEGAQAEIRNLITHKLSEPATSVRSR
jgi:hypothetical protein